VELTWFRRPADGRPGTLNLCYNALDRHVIAGSAEAPAAVAAAETLDFAHLLERVSALAGALRGLGVGPGRPVAIEVDDALDGLVAQLACARLAAVYGSLADLPEPELILASRDVSAGAAVRVLRGLEPTDPTRDIAWELAVRAGREDPAACAAVPSDAVAFVADGEPVTVLAALLEPAWANQWPVMLADGQTVDVNGGTK
jgi:non-ribosomal peptide synthetase component F